MKADTFSVKIWGARGSMASSAKLCERYGGNTSCVEVTCGDQTLIFDAGSGLRMLGNKLMQKKAKKLNLFFTHCHYDHISGLPFFAPFFSPKSKINIWSGHLSGKGKTQQMVQEYMRPPFFPVGPEVFSADISYNDFSPMDTLKPGKGIKVETIALNHHDGCVGYRVNYKGRSFCFITDTSHVPDMLDAPLVEFVRGADLMIYDATYTDKEFPIFASFGHSTWEEGIRICQAADVKRYCIFHHRPSRTDKAIDKILEKAKKRFKRSYAAYEGLVIKL